MFREDEVIVLLGAGSSVQAGIPHSKKMIEELESLLRHEKTWNDYEDLYYFMKSSILYADGILGKFENNFDIERLVNILSELEKRETAELYPFIGSWNQRLIELAGYDFDIIKKFKQDILTQLLSWVTIQDYDKSAYYKGLYKFQTEYNFSLRVFTLNYDLCVERNKPEDKNLEIGFDEKTKAWDWKRFQRKEAFEPDVYLYKMHGSIDWERDPRKTNIIRQTAHPSKNPDLIFGTNYKLQYVDPYLFYAYELRRYSLEAGVILTIGYSFRDEHINGIIEQALQKERDKKVVVVSPKAEKQAEAIHKALSCHKQQVIALNKGAKEFFEQFSVSTLWDQLGRTDNDDIYI